MAASAFMANLRQPEILAKWQVRASFANGTLLQAELALGTKPWIRRVGFVASRRSR